MAKKQQMKASTAPDYKPKPMANSATITDYNQNLLVGPIKQMKVGQKVRLQMMGEVTKLEERYSKGNDSYDNRCEIQLTPTSVAVAKGSGGNMVSEINAERTKRGGAHYADESTEAVGEDG